MDPVALKFERDGLVATYKKRVADVESYACDLERQLKHTHEATNT